MYYTWRVQCWNKEIMRGLSSARKTLTRRLSQINYSYDLLKGYYQTNNFRLTRKYPVVLLILLT